jgi:hypothetical protein
MFKNLSYKQKIKLTGLGALLALLLCYRFSISRTIDEYRLYADRSSVARGAAGATTLQGIQAKERRVAAMVGRYALDTLLPEKNLLSVAGNYCKNNGLLLKEYRPFHFSRNDSIPVLTRIVTVQGAFIPCLKLWYAIETGGKVGKLSSAEFKSYTDPLDKKTKLDCTLYIQNLISTNHEEH